MRVINTEKLPIKIWISIDSWVKGNYEEDEGFKQAMEQAKNLANHPLCRKWVALMPDFHVGYGMPIGGVIATQGGVIPNAVGVDIGCGMMALQLNISSSELDREKLEKIRETIHKYVPTGFSKHAKPMNCPLLDEYTLEELGVLHDPVISKEHENAAYQLGTLGGGNHFIEVQEDQDGMVWVMIHSGSRNLGKKVCDYYHNIAKKYMEAYHSNIPDIDLAFIPEVAPEYEQYLTAMRFCMKFAEASRTAMSNAIISAFDEVLPSIIEVTQRVETHHNFAEMEHHFGQNFLIHRKGAVKAVGLVTIPGSMGTASYICKGMANPESFCSCSHGAGRIMGRKYANKVITHEQAVESMKHVVFGLKQGDYDEMPMAYKDIEEVIDNQRDLIDPVYRLKPLAVCKG